MSRWITYLRFLIGKIFSPPILILTLTGNALILMFSVVFFFTETGKNGEIQTLFDAIWWAFSTVTTVGYGDLVPATLAGRILSIFLMLMGTGLFVAHTALLANIFLDRKFMLLFNKKNKETTKTMQQQTAILKEEENIHDVLNEIKTKVDRLDEWLKEQPR